LTTAARQIPDRARSSLADRAHGLTPVLAHYWWALFLRGALAIAIGLVTLFWPDLSFAVLLLFVATWFVADGAIALLQAFMSAERWPHVLDASLSFMAGAVAIFYPAISGAVLTLTMASWFIAKGVTQGLFAIRFGGTHPGAWLLGAVGIATVGFGVFLARDPAAALSSLALISGFAILLGLSFVALGWWLER
jgi:uncharacterized membrane protein HdeD (DUF308 family)